MQLTCDQRTGHALVGVTKSAFAERSGPAADLGPSDLLAAEVAGFEAKPGQRLLLGSRGDAILLGLGDGSPRAVQDAFATLCKQARKLSWSYTSPVAGQEFLPHLRHAAEGVWLGRYAFDRLRQQRGREAGEAAGTCDFRLPAGVDGEAAEAVLARTAAVMGGVWLARDLVNTPAIDLYPERFSELVAGVAQEHGLGCTVWRGKELLGQRCGLIHAVGMGSARPPCLLRLEYGKQREGRPTIALVGKGVTFDSGGLNLKPADGMLLMKKDMTGAATVLGAVQALAAFGVDVHVRAYLPMAENMTGEAAYRPGDVITSRAGLTVEIGNTDAEGRLLLADALHMAVEDGADWLLDIATLTGACRIALGKKVMGLFSNHDELAQRLLAASRETGEDIWRLPLHAEYAAMLESPVADVNNAGKDRFGGAITAALFLEKFVGNARWAHLDCYGWSDSQEPGFPVGANGLGVRLLVRAVELLGSTG